MVTGEQDGDWGNMMVSVTGWRKQGGDWVTGDWGNRMVTGGT